MTDTVDEIVVVGQRRRNGSDDPFPTLPSSPGPQWPGQDAEIDPDDNGQLNPCDNPNTKREWNMDAAAAAAVAAFLQDALNSGESNLEHRERGAFILRNPNGTYSLGPIQLGSVFAPSGSGVQPATTLDPTLVGDMARIVGVIHNHNAGQHLPSAPSDQYPGDQAGLQTVVNIMNHYNQGTGQNARMYIIAKAADGSYRVSVYMPDTVKYGEDGTPPEVGPEVNPDGESCPLQ